MEPETFQGECQKDSSASHYEDYFQYLSDELRLLDLFLLRSLRIKQKNTKEYCSTSKGFFIPEEEVISLLDSSGESHSPSSEDPAIEITTKLIEEVRDGITSKLANTANHIERFPLLKLARIFGLSPFEAEVMMMALAAEIDKKYERIYAYFNDDMTKKLPSMSIALDVLLGNRIDKLNGWRSFSPHAPLLYFHLIHVVDDHGESSFLNHRFRLDERIKRYIAADNGPHASLSGIVQAHCPDVEVPVCNIQKEVQERVLQVLTEGKRGNALHPVFWLYGKAREEKKATALAICEQVKLPLLAADLEDLFLEPDYKSIVKTLFREAALQPAALFIGGGDRLYGEDERSGALRRVLLRAINEMSWITFISSESLWIPEESEGQYQWYPFEFKAPEYAERRRIWIKNLNKSKLSESDIDSLSARFNFGETQIRNAVSCAKQFANGSELTLDKILDACRIQSNQKLSIYATKVRPHYTWDDIVLPEDKVQQLKEICSYIDHKQLVYFKWGFEEKLALGRGLNILFSGASGTGKTMAADIIANALKLEMVKVDLSSVVSKYIGETEKNLNRIFRETSAGNIILFFDEADALFGKRTEVKDAHDRYANIEINYLLQKMEEHEGIVILATNLSKNLDEAFLRRMHFSIEFPLPDEKRRELIWRKIFPRGVPLSDDVDYGFISERFKVTGGNIRNMALAAAFYAAEDSSEIRMDHLILAVQRELQKMGKLCVKGDFGMYYQLIEERLKHE